MSDALNKECKNIEPKICEKSPILSGECCCNCLFQFKIMKHPKNKGNFKGSISEQLGWGCNALSGEDCIFKDCTHGICEFYTPKIIG